MKKKNRFNLIMISLIIFSINLSAEVKITADRYDFLNKTSPTLQNYISDYHNELVNNPNQTGTFNLYSFSDGSPEEGPYKSSYETKDGYKGAELQLIICHPN